MNIFCAKFLALVSWAKCGPCVLKRCFVCICREVQGYCQRKAWPIGKQTANTSTPGTSPSWTPWGLCPTGDAAPGWARRYPWRDLCHWGGQGEGSAVSETASKHGLNHLRHKCIWLLELLKPGGIITWVTLTSDLMFWCTDSITWRLAGIHTCSALHDNTNSSAGSNFIILGMQFLRANPCLEV